MTGGHVAPTPLPGDSFWVDEGLLLAGPYPGAIDRAEAAEKLEAFLDVGITTFVDLTEAGEPSPKDGPLQPYDELLSGIATRRGITVQHVRMPIRDVSIPTAAEMEAILAFIIATIEEQNPIYVHCCGGIGRTGTVVGCLAIETGARPESVLDELAALRAGTERGTRRSPETDEQRQFVRDWAHTCSEYDPAPIEASAWNPHAIDHYPIFVRSKANHERWDLAVQIAQATIGEPGLIDGEVLGIARVIYSNQIQSGE
jgi:hypothetical protein